MDYNEKVEYLKSYRDKCDRIVFIDKQLKGIKAISYGPSLGGRKSIGEYMDEIARLDVELKEIEKTVNSLEKKKESVVLGYRYFQYKSFKEIAGIINYSVKQTRRFHDCGIKNLKI